MDLGTTYSAVGIYRRSASTTTFDNTDEALHPDPGAKKDFQIEDNSSTYIPRAPTRPLDVARNYLLQLGVWEWREVNEAANEAFRVAEKAKHTQFYTDKPTGYHSQRGHASEGVDRLSDQEIVEFKEASSLLDTASGEKPTTQSRVNRLTTYQNHHGQRGVRGTVNDHDIWAFCDTGAGQNIMSTRQAKEMGLKIKHSPALLRMGNSNQILSPGFVRFQWSFPDEPLNVTTIIARVLDNFMYDCLLGNPFLQSTKLMTKHLHRFVKGAFPSRNLWRLNLLGETSQRVHGSLGNNVPMEALPDIGSSRNIMDEAWAQSMGFTIRTGPKHCGLILFPDNTTRATIGQVHTTITLSGGEVQPIVFEILPNCYVPVVLGEDFVFDNNLFMNHADAIFEVEGIDSTHDLLPMYYHSSSLAKIRKGAKLFLRPKKMHNKTPANEPFNEREERHRQRAWNQAYAHGREAAETEWDAEYKRRVDHEKKRDPTWLPSDDIPLIAFRPSTGFAPYNLSHIQPPSSTSTSFHQSETSQETGSGQYTDTSQYTGSSQHTDNGHHTGNSQYTKSGQYDVPPDTSSETAHSSTQSFYDPDQFPPSSGEFGAEEADCWGS